jgi:cytoskeletal protein CcmA (bactofilin family)
MFNKKTGDEQTEPAGMPDRTTPSAGSSPAPAEPAVPPAPQAKSVASGGAATVLAEGAKFTGTAEVAGTLRVEGTAEGTIRAGESLVVGKSGDVQADVKTRRAVLNGRFRGKIEAEDRVEVQTGCDVEGEIQAKNMVMEDGLRFRGQVQIGE